MCIIPSYCTHRTLRLCIHWQNIHLNFLICARWYHILENSQPLKTLVFRLGEGVVWSGIVEVYSRQLGQLHRVHYIWYQTRLWSLVLAWFMAGGGSAQGEVSQLVFNSKRYSGRLCRDQVWTDLLDIGSHSCTSGLGNGICGTAIGGSSQANIRHGKLDK